jgi:hypothetical protein
MDTTDMNENEKSKRRPKLRLILEERLLTLRQQPIACQGVANELGPAVGGNRSPHVYPCGEASPYERPLITLQSPAHPSPIRVSC